MSAEQKEDEDHEKYGHKWFLKQYAEEVEILNQRKSYKEQEEEGAEKIKFVLEDINTKHLSKIPEMKTVKTQEEIYDEMRNNKDEFPQLWELDGKDGVHEIMQKRVPQNPTAPILRDIYPRQEKKDWRRFHKRINGWGKYHNMTRSEFSEYFLEECINSLFVVAEFIDRHPNHPISKYYIKTLFNK